MRLMSQKRPFFVDSAGELRELIGFTMLDHFHIETHPVTTAQELAEFFEQDAAAS